MKDLLPSTEHEFAFGDGHRQGMGRASCLQMRVAIAIVPGLLMAVVTAGWNELVENCRQIAFQARLEFNRTQRRLTCRLPTLRTYFYGTSSNTSPMDSDSQISKIESSLVSLNISRICSLGAISLR